VAKSQRFEPKAVTSVSWAATAMVMLAIAASARAGGAPAPPASGFEGRHRVGAQLGGTGVLQAVYRYRAIGPLHLELGALGVDHAANVSAGVLVGVPIADRWFPNVGLGGGAMWAFGPRTANGCDATTTDCPTVTDSDTLRFVHARVGVGVAFGATRRHLLSADFGGWRGTHVANRTDAAGHVTQTSTTVFRPVLGLSYFFVL
jgi:hypothetical protein